MRDCSGEGSPGMTAGAVWRRRARALLTAGWVMLSRRAARVTLFSVITAEKISIRLRSILPSFMTMIIGQKILNLPLFSNVDTHPSS